MNDDATTQELPDTGISGVYEVMVGVEDAAPMIKYFQEFGFEVIKTSSVEAPQAAEIYGVHSKLTAFRMQNGDIDSHGLIRILEWASPISQGMGYVPPETIGQRMAVMMTNDIFRLHDVFLSARKGGEQWLPTEPIAADLFDLDKGKKDFYNRPVIVRENAVYGAFFNHVFFQRYGYEIPGYGTIGQHSKLKTSELTHHDFIINAKEMSDMSYLSTALGLKAEDEPAIDGDWQDGPRSVFVMEPGFSHWYQGFVSPNNICGKMKFFIPRSTRPDASKDQVIGALGITLHSFYTPKLTFVHKLVTQHNLNPSDIGPNEFGEASFIFTGPGGVSWQIIEAPELSHEPKTEIQFQLTQN